MMPYCDTKQDEVAFVYESEPEYAPESVADDSTQVPLLAIQVLEVPPEDELLNLNVV